ncbi:MAG: mechanosensitive ion channel domain-containing protein [Parasphingorhabdus sp.]|uniref:mechanosensitive ion channel domain-containing protein n=1 Tax=Parasphingorhabdus sp. TaxID=2709688 RepID=UPI00300268FD
MFAAAVAILGAPTQKLAAQVDAEEAAAPTQPAIDAETVGEDDEVIAERLRGIFGEIDGFDNIRVAVDSGVVRLSGTLEDQAAIDRASAIAQRVSGVVTVETDFERDLSVGSNVEPVVDDLSSSFDQFLAALPLIGVALLVAILVGLFGHFIASLKSFWQKITPNVFLAELVASSVRVIFIGLGIFIALDILGATAAIGAVLGGAGVIGLAVGFALRDTVDNYISSIMLSIRQPFRANDHVLVGQQEGRVVRLTSRATILMTLEGNHLRIPNATVFKAEILNYTRNPQRRFTFELGVDADDDPAAAVDTGLRAINGQDYVLDDPEATAEIREVGDSNIIIAFHGWVDQRESDFKKARGAAIRVTKNALEDEGFALPEPIYRLRFDGGLPDQVVQRSGSKKGASAPKQTKPTASETDFDVSPEDHVEHLVDSERSGQSEPDLLDNNRPVE